ncbi:S8/S53 family peptidase [Algicella marina]|uniref:S8 family serine peptidase n=1 Tax=Algicella marina TaxID=2683284 RepID=A0A6P1T1P2_9RHOB|nr:S8/S53 family peptidase [Algicella marina]QHQ36834.1 S8 family serine peptidase [Algicella marina]
MPEARKRLLKNVTLTDSVKATLDARSGTGAAESLAGSAMVDAAGKTAQVWGLVGPEDDVNTVRSNLLDKAEVVTLIEDADVSEAKRKVGHLECGGQDCVLPRKPAAAKDERKAVAVSLPMVSAQIPSPKFHWTPAKNGASSFGTAGEAMTLIGADWSNGHLGHRHPEWTGANVNVVIIDVGFTLDYLRAVMPGMNYGGGFIDRDPRRHKPGEFVDIGGKPGAWHGNMIARNVLRLAPEARLYDAPLLPSRVTQVDGFTEDAELLYNGIREAKANGPHADEPWVLVNAWAVADTIQEYDLDLPTNERFSDGPDHPLNKLVREMAAEFDIIFAAGNFGAFGPDVSAGVYDRGNGRSIKGVNALPDVLTVGAVTTNGEWIGNASHGLGPASLNGGEPNRKPDVAAPSWFGENDDPGTICTGTSAACGVVAGMVAGLRTVYRTEPPSEIFGMLKSGARQPTQDGWNGRFGHGIVDFDGMPSTGAQMIS